MAQIGTVTIAGFADLQQRFGSDGLASLGLAGPLISPVWTQAVPTSVNLATLQFTAANAWYTPLAGMFFDAPNGMTLGLSGLDGAPAMTGNQRCAIFKIHPQARLRLERAIVANLEIGGRADQSLRPVVSTILIRGANTPVTTAQLLRPGELALPAGDISFHDERGLIIDCFAFAAMLSALAVLVPFLQTPLPAGPTNGTTAAIASLAPSGNFFHVVDLHGRPWVDPPAALGIGMFTGPQNPPQQVARVANGLIMAWPANAVLAAEADPTGQQPPSGPAISRFGWGTIGTLGTAPLAWPPAPATLSRNQMPVRDSLRVIAVDLQFHLAGNRLAARRDGVIGADPLSVAEQAPQIRDGSQLTLMTDGRAILAAFGQTIAAILPGTQTGPIYGISVTFDDGLWPLPFAPNARWPQLAQAVPVAGTIATILAQLAAMRTSPAAIAAWIAGTNDVLVSLNGLPNGVHVRLYPRKIEMGQTPDQAPLLTRGDGAGTFIAAGTGQIVLRDPFSLGQTPVNPRKNSTLMADALVAWVPQLAPAFPETHIIGNLNWPVLGDVAAPTAAAVNFLSSNFWKGSAPSPILGVPGSRVFSLAPIATNPVAFVTSVARQLSTDQNPRQAPRLPTMARTETVLSVQLQGGNGYFSVLTGAWLTKDADTHAHRAGNPGGAGNHEVHAPGISATGQLGFDLWVAAAHRARPITPTVDIAGTINGQPNNWILQQANAASTPPAPPQPPTTIVATVLQTVPAFVETPELAIIPDDDVAAVTAWVTNQLAAGAITANDPELGRQMVREVRTAKYGRRDTQWALRRAIQQARELIYVETPLFGQTFHSAGNPGVGAGAELIVELANRLSIEPRLRVVVLLPRIVPFGKGFEPWSAFFYQARNSAASTLRLAGGVSDGESRVIFAHPMGAPGRPLIIRTTTIIVDDVWCLTGTSNISRRGLTFDGSLDVVVADRAIDRGAGVAIRAHRKALMGIHLGLAPGPDANGLPTADWVRLEQGLSAHRVFAEQLKSAGNGKLLPLWPGPDSTRPGAVQPHLADVADPDGRGGATLVQTLASALAGNGAV
jgi:hypothetical protein